MRISITQIGNSRGIRLPKSIIDQCGIIDEVDLIVENNRIILNPLPKRDYKMNFQNISKMNDLEIQTFLREVSAFTLAMSLINASEEIKFNVFKNMSERAAKYLKEEIERLNGLTVKELLIEMHKAEIDSIFEKFE